MNWLYFACNRCNTTFRTTIDNPDSNVKCANCEYERFHEIKKKEYNPCTLKEATKMTENDIYFYACCRCGQTLRTSLDNPTSHLHCGACDYDAFHKISKEDYDAAQGRIYQNENQP